MLSLSKHGGGFRQLLRPRPRLEVLRKPFEMTHGNRQLGEHRHHRQERRRGFLLQAPERVRVAATQTAEVFVVGEEPVAQALRPAVHIEVAVEIREREDAIGDDARDFVAVRKIMGHASADIADEYRERVSDERLVAVADYVRGWLFKEKAPIVR